MLDLALLRLLSPDKSCRDLASTWRPILTAAMALLVRKDEDGSGQLRFQCGCPVVTIQDAPLPHQKIRVLSGKFIPIRALRSGHTFANQEEVCVRDGLVVELCLPASGSESLQGRNKSLQGGKNRIFAQIGKRQADMVNVVERVFRNSIIFKAPDDFLMAHGKTLARPLTTLPYGDCPGRRRVDHERADVGHPVPQVNDNGQHKRADQNPGAAGGSSWNEQKYGADDLTPSQ